ncbi:MAG: S8 family serine peptidase [Clostridia bacterium]|nr:S8 family serine peptidase [Clostridia bacterium]
MIELNTKKKRAMVRIIAVFLSLIMQFVSFVPAFGVNIPKVFKAEKVLSLSEISKLLKKTEISKEVSKSQGKANSLEKDSKTLEPMALPKNLQTALTKEMPNASHKAVPVKQSVGNEQVIGGVIPAKPVNTLAPSDIDSMGIVVKYKNNPENRGVRGPSNNSFEDLGTVKEMGENRILLKPGKTNDRLDQLIEKIEEDLQVEYAEPNYSLNACEEVVYPNDEFYSEQTGLKETIAAPAAWELLKNADEEDNLYDGEEVKLAVLDTGVDAAHEDLTGRVVPGINLISDAADPSDTRDGSKSGHGTFVAGIAAANTNNGKGIAGAAGEFPVKVMPVKVLDAYGRGTMLDVSNGIRWAADNGAKVINLSLGARLPDFPKTLNESIEYAQSKGVVIVAAAGNEGRSLEGFYPACLPGVLAVCASDNTGKLASFSNFVPGGFNNEGYMIHAPGINIKSTLPGKDNQGACRYSVMSGTSMAAPFASACAAILRSVYPKKASTDVFQSIIDGCRQAAYKEFVLNMADTVKYLQTAELDDYIALTNPKLGTGNLNMSGSIDLSARVSLAKEIDKVKFFIVPVVINETNNAMNAKPFEIGDVAVDQNSRESGIYNFKWDTTLLDANGQRVTPDGRYYIYAEAYKILYFDGEPYESRQYSTSSYIDPEKSCVVVTNETSGGLKIKVLNPTGGSAAGCEIKVSHILDTPSGYKIEPAAQMKADREGRAMIPAHVAIDGNKYIISAIGSIPENFVYFSVVTGPTEITLSSADAKKLVIDAKKLDGSNLSQGEVYLDNCSFNKNGNYPQGIPGNLFGIPAGVLNSNGKMEVWVTKGNYDLKLASLGEGYYLKKEGVVVDNSGNGQVDISFKPAASDIASLNFKADDINQFEQTSIILVDEKQVRSAPFSFHSKSKSLIVSPGSYSAEVSALYCDKAKNEDWVWTLEVSKFNVAASTEKEVTFGGTVTSKVTLNGKPENHEYIYGESVKFDVAFNDAYGNKTLSMVKGEHRDHIFDVMKSQLKDNTFKSMGFEAVKPEFYLFIVDNFGYEYKVDYSSCYDNFSSVTLRTGSNGISSNNYRAKAFLKTGGIPSNGTDIAGNPAAVSDFCSFIVGTTKESPVLTVFIKDFKGGGKNNRLTSTLYKKVENRGKPAYVRAYEPILSGYQSVKDPYVFSEGILKYYGLKLDPDTQYAW